MNCTAHIWNEPTGLACTRLDPHDVGHIFETSDGSSVADRHAGTE